MYLKILEKFLYLTSPDGLWAGHIPFILMIKIKFLAQFPVDRLPHPVASSLKHFCANLLDLLILWFIGLSHHRIIYICYFVGLIYYCFESVSPNGIFALLLEEIQFLCHIHALLTEISLSINRFLKFSFFSYFRFVDTCVACIVTGRCNQSLAFYLSILRVVVSVLSSVLTSPLPSFYLDT